MKPIEIKVRYIPFNKVDIVIYPFIFWLDYYTPTADMRRHVNIHLRQQIECLWVFFFIIYGINFLINLIRFRNIELAYRMICFESEAYYNQANMIYLKRRKKYSWIWYLRS